MISYSTIIDNSRERNKEVNRINKMVKEVFPISTKILTFFLVIVLFSILYHLFNTMLITTWVTSLLSSRSIIIHITVFIILDALVLLPVFKEFPNANQQLLSIKPRLLQSFIITMTLYSLLTCMLLIPIVNKVFDKSKPIEEIATIGRKEKEIHRKEPNHFYLYFNQTFYDVNNIEVTLEEYNSVNEGDQIKIQIADGFLGLKYKTGTIQAIKKDGDTSK